MLLPATDPDNVAGANWEAPPPAPPACLLGEDPEDES